jgi:ubiquinone/menaquinone biosynthesis C-methylase UbiE
LFTKQYTGIASTLLDGPSERELILDQKECRKEGTLVDKPMSSIGFKLMSLMFKVRDAFRPRMDLLKEVGIKPGFRVLDYGCGPGSYIVPLAELTGPSGEIIALDITPRAIKEVRKIAVREGLENIETIESDCRTELPDNHVDVALFYDTYHDLSQPDDVLREIHRVLKTDGTLSFSDHHMKEKEIVEKVTAAGLFRLSKKNRRTYSFSKLN